MRRLVNGRAMRRGVRGSLAMALLILGAPQLAMGDDTPWTVTPLEPGAYPAEIVPEGGAPAPAPDGLPDGRIAEAAGLDVVRAWYIAPTTRYGHAVLGDGIEAGGLAIETAEGAVVRTLLDEEAVFEDRTPRLADLDGDGRAEIVTLLATQTAGGAVSVFGLRDGALREVARGPAIGRPFRWLNIAGIADFAGLGRDQIAVVNTPHIGGILHIYDLVDGALRRVGRPLSGFSNHAIGDRELRLSAVADLNGDGRPDLAIPSANRGALRFVTVGARGPRAIGSVDLPGRVAAAILAEDAGPDLRFILGLVGGAQVAVSR